MTGRTIFRGITWKLVFWFLTVAVIPLALSLGIVSLEMVRLAKENVSRELALVRDMEQERFLMWFEEKKTDVRELAEDTTIRSLLEALHDGDRESHREAMDEARSALQRQMALRRDFLQFFVIDAANGDVIISTDPSFEGQKRSRDTYFTGPLETGRLFVKDIFISEYLKGKPGMTISIPVFCLSRGGGYIDAVLVGRLDLEGSLFLLLQERQGLGETGESLIVNRDGIALNRLRYDKNAPLIRKITAEPARLAAAGGTGVVESRDYRGTKVLAAYTYLPELGWGFVAKKDTSEVYAPIWSLVGKIVMIGFVSSLVIGVLAVLVARSLSKPLMEMSDVTRRIAEGDLGARNRGDSAEDEIGVLARSINRTADSLQSRFALLEGLSEVVGAAVGSHDRRGYAARVFDVLMDRTKAHMGVFYVLSPDRRTLQPAFAVGMEPAAWEPMECGSLEGILGLSSLSDDVTRINQLSDASPFVFRGPGGVAEAREIMAIPLLATGELEGLICLGSLTGFGEDDEALARESRHVLATGLDRVLASERVEEMTVQLQSRNDELMNQAEELRRQSDELHDQNVEMEHQQRMIEEANRLKSEFLSNMSHELRTPLNSILALSRVLMRRGKDRPEGEDAKYLGVIERNGRQLLDLINDILDLSKIESGRVEIRPAFFSLRESVESLIETLKPLAEEKQISLKMEIPEALPPLKSDETRVRQILRNLLGNAVKFTSEGGVTISALEEGGDVVVSVSDTGIGIPDKDLPYIFDEFRQVDGTAARHFEGTGLGLAIARKSTFLLGGSLEVESKEGVGSTFMLRLPLNWKDPIQISQREEMAPERTRNAVIVVEDDPSSASTISSLLERIGYESTVARTGPDALRLAREIKPVAITLDLVMPEMDGWEVLQNLRQDPSTSDIPVVIISVRNEEETARALGAEGYLIKPVSSEVLEREIRRICGHGEGMVLVAGSGETSGVQGEGQRRTILMVEDNEIAAEQVKGLIEEERIAEVEVAGDGQRALAYMKKRTPDAIILDLMMPGIDGFSVLDRLRENERTARIPVLILTAKDLTKEDLSRLRNNNVQQLVQKGDVNREDLLHKVRLLFHEAQACPEDLRPDVLYIEDNPDDMTTMRAMLADRYRIAGALSGHEGLRKAASMKPKVVLLDLTLPDMDGLEVLSRLKDDPATTDIPVAAVTARAMKGDRKKALEAGCRAYVTKPVDPDEMHSILERLIP